MSKKLSLHLRFAAALCAMAIAPTQLHAADAPLRVAIVGLVHGHVQGFLRNLPQNNNFDLVAIVEPDTALAQRYAARFHLDSKIFYTDTERMLVQQHPDAVLVYTTIQDHRKVIETAARHGISSMVEKPLATSLSDALAIRAAAREHHVQVLVNYETTWYASNHAAFGEAWGGQIGEVRRVEIHDGHQGPKEIGVPPEFFNWLTDPAKNGAGALYDFGCYGADLMTTLMRGETPLTVTAVVNHDKPQIYPRVDDDATIVLTYPHTQAVIMASWNWPFGRKDMEVYGATGYAITVGPDKLRRRHEHDTAEESVTVPPEQGFGRDSLTYLKAVIANELVPHGDLTSGGTNGAMIIKELKGDQSSLDTNVIVMQILDAARESARTGKSVNLTKLGD